MVDTPAGRVPRVAMWAQTDAIRNGMSVKETSKRRLLSRWPAAFIAAVLIGTTALVLYVEASISKLKQVLPVEVLRQERDVVFMIDDLAALQQAIREARAHPGIEGRQIVIDRVELVESRVSELIEAYSFSNQIGIASMHATLRPVAGDLKLWLSDGVQGLSPDSEVVLDLAAERVAAARRAEAHAFIQTLEDPRGRRGYNAHVGERGVKLSGGQRQRIAIARVMLKDAPILILDEATASLDSVTEKTIQENLDRAMGRKTVIAIAHRLSTIAHLDRILVFDQGRIVEDGSHDSLLARKGFYHRLWTMQAGGFLPDEQTGD